MTQEAAAYPCCTHCAHGQRNSHDKPCAEGCSAAQTHQTLTEAVEQAERDDPAVAKAVADLDDAIDRLNDRAALHRFRPLPWDR